VNLVGSGDGSHDDAVVDHPIDDVHDLLAEAAAAGLDSRHDAYISFHLRFDDRSAWERAAKAAAAHWEVSAYSRPEAHMLWLSAPTALTEAAVRRRRADILAFAADNDAVWESVAVEDLAPVSAWKTIAAQRTAAHDEDQADEPEIEQALQGGAGGDVA